MPCRPGSLDPRLDVENEQLLVRCARLPRDAPTTHMQRKSRGFDPASSAYVHVLISEGADGVYSSRSCEEGVIAAQVLLEASKGILDPSTVHADFHGSRVLEFFGMEHDEAQSVVLIVPISSCWSAHINCPQSAVLSHTFTISPPPYAQSDPLISPLWYVELLETFPVDGIAHDQA